MGRFDSAQNSEKCKRCKLVNGNPCIPCSKTIEIDNLITQAKSNLDNLLSRRRDLYAEINSSHERIVHRLPPEVSTSIFLFSLSEDGPLSVYDAKKADTSKKVDITTPLTLGAVCRLWRNIAWASPALWTNISIPAKPRSNYNYLNIAYDWLRRSGQLPLSIRIYAPPAARVVDDPNLLGHLSELIGRYISRCHRLEFSCPCTLLPAVYERAPKLQEIKITSDDKDREPPIIILRSLKSNGVRLSVIGCSLDILDLPFVYVLEFEGLVTFKECVSTLKDSPNLQECRILGLKQSPSPNVGSHRVTHNRLERLTLHSKRNSSAAVLEAVRLPSLTHLTVSKIEPSSIHRFVIRSLCNLQYLYLEVLRFDGEEFCDMLRACNSLKELHLVGDRIHDFHVKDLLKYLAQTPVIRKRTDSTCPPLLPNLCVFTIRFRTQTKFPWDLSAGIFGSIDDIRDPLRRPIKHFQIMHGRNMEFSGYGGLHRHFDGSDKVGGSSSSKLLLDKKVAQHFIDIAYEGINVNLYDVYSKDDILRLAMVRHKIAVPEWYEPKEPPSVLPLKFSEVPLAGLKDEESDSDSSAFESD